MSLLDKIRKTCTIKESSILSESKFFNRKDMIPTSIPAINVALSGRLDGGLTPGLTMWAGPSKHFKTMFSLLMAKSFMDKYPDSVMLFYDSEFGTPQEYFSSYGIDIDRVYHIPIKNIEELKFDIVKQLDSFTREDNVIIVADSIGNLASVKEVDDALDGKSVADMSRAKQLKSLFRIITPYLVLKDIPMIAVNHTYKTMELYAKDVVGGGTGSYYAADNIFIIGRQQEKNSNKDLVGWNFIINVEKSRYVIEKSKIPITVRFDGGISKWSGLMDMALESGHVTNPSQGWYCRASDPESKKYRLKDTDTKEFWLPILSDATFNDWIKTNYQISSGKMLTDEVIDEEVSSLEFDGE